MPVVAGCWKSFHYYLLKLSGYFCFNFGREAGLSHFPIRYLIEQDGRLPPEYFLPFGFGKDALYKKYSFLIKFCNFKF